MKINLGCGNEKLEGFVNVDVDPGVKPDQVADITKRLPFPDDSIELVSLSHTIEHIERKYHPMLISEVMRILKPGGKFFLAFPNFRVCANNYLKNENGMRDFWENAVMGRGITIHDTHVCAMLPEQFVMTLIKHGFIDIRETPEGQQPHNSLIWATKPETIIGA